MLGDSNKNDKPSYTESAKTDDLGKVDVENTQKEIVKNKKLRFFLTGLRQVRLARWKFE